MRELLRWLFHMKPDTNEFDMTGIEIVDELSPTASPEKLAEAEAWTAGMERQAKALKREAARYALELNLESGNTANGIARAHNARRTSANSSSSSSNKGVTHP